MQPPDYKKLQVQRFIKALREQEKLNPPDSFFLSANWLEPYVQAWETEEFREIFCAQLGSAEQTIFAAISQNRSKSKLGTRYISIALNQAYLPKINDINIEQGGFAGTSRSNLGPGLNALLEYLFEDPSWHELKLNALLSSQDSVVLDAAKKYNLNAIQTYNSTSYYIKFDEIRAKHNGDYLTSRSANTRQQIRRSLKLLETEFGKVMLKHPADLSEAHSWLDDLNEMHRARWNTDSESSGFMKPAFVKFHHDILNTYFESNVVKIVRVTAGATTLGINMYYIFQDGACFTFGGVNYAIDPKTRPGIVTHYLAINDFLKKDYKIYDFLEGRHRYKESLCTHTEENHGWALQRKRLDLVLENKLRNAKRKVRSLASKFKQQAVK